MKTLKFNTLIDAQPKKVWEVLWNDETYKQWTELFSPGSKAVSDWQEGSTILFVDGSDSGMYSKILKSVPHEMMIFQHLGIVKNGNKIEDTEDAKAWAGSEEAYYLKENNGKTNLDVTLDSTEEFQEFFQESFPKALKKIKELSER